MGDGPDANNETRLANLFAKVDRSNEALEADRVAAEQRRLQEKSDGEKMVQKRDEFRSNLGPQIDALNELLRPRGRALQILDVKRDGQSFNALVDVVYKGVIGRGNTQALLRFNCRTLPSPHFEAVVIGAEKLELPEAWFEPEGIRSLLIDFMEQAESKSAF